MADEITVNVKLSVTKGTLVQRFEPGALSFDMTGSVASGGVASIPTTAAGTALNMGSVTTAGWTYLRNTDANNYVEVGVQVAGTFYPSVKLKAGEAGVVRLGTNAPYARANTAAVNLQYFIFQD